MLKPSFTYKLTTDVVGRFLPLPPAWGLHHVLIHSVHIAHTVFLLLPLVEDVKSKSHPIARSSVFFPSSITRCSSSWLEQPIRSLFIPPPTPSIWCFSFHPNWTVVIRLGRCSYVSYLMQRSETSGNNTDHIVYVAHESNYLLSHLPSPHPR